MGIRKHRTQFYADYIPDTVILSAKLETGIHTTKQQDCWLLQCRENSCALVFGAFPALLNALCDGNLSLTDRRVHRRICVIRPLATIQQNHFHSFWNYAHSLYITPRACAYVHTLLNCRHTCTNSSKRLNLVTISLCSPANFKCYSKYLKILLKNYIQFNDII